MPSETIWNSGELRDLFESPHGEVARELARMGTQVQNRMKALVSGPWHGEWSGHGINASSPGSPPGVRTGRLRGSITFHIGVDGEGLYCAIGPGVNYGAILESRGNAPYPFMVKSLEAAH